MATVKATTRPSRPTIDTVMDNMPPYTGVIEKGGLTNDPRPTVSGRGDAGSIIHVLVDGREVGTVVVKANGTWSFALPQSLSDGEYRLTARASNDAGWSVPSASYGIVVDTTPPSRPTIEAATEGTQPMLSGRAETYSTVTVYDGMKVLGMATTGIDGAWTFKLPSGLSNGTHSLTVTAMDPAGNTSAASAGFDVTIGPVTPPTPTTQAILDEMGRDSGSFNFDRVTNDGTAGRLLSGHLTAALAAGEKVQVSTDGGKTWVDASMKSDGVWVAVDPSAHAGDWKIQTRVMNDAGGTGKIATTDVTLKTSAMAPTAVASKDGVITVKFIGLLTESGSKLSVLCDNQTVTHVLTAAEIAAGTAAVRVPGGAGLAYAAAIVDTAGNASQYKKVDGFKFKEDFNSYKSISLYSEEKASFQYFDITGIKDLGRTYWKQGLYSGNDCAIPGGYVLSSPPSTTALIITGEIRLDLRDGLSATHFACDVGDVTTSENLVLTFYDRNGKAIHKAQAITASKGALQHIEIDMPDGLLFTSIKFEQTWTSQPNWIATWVDNLAFSGPRDGGFVDSPSVQNLVGDSAYYGARHGTTFTVESLSYFANGGSGAYGSAGIDTLKLTGKNQVLDIAALNSGITEKITGIEVFDLTGTGNNTLKLTMKDVLNLGHEDLFMRDGHTQLLVKGDAGDQVYLSGMPGLEAGTWSNKGLTAIDGYAYNVYENASLNVELIVQHAVTIHMV